MRVERDFLGEVSIEETALYGIHSLRAQANFPDQTPFSKEWYQAMGAVKKACYLTYHKFKQQLMGQFDCTEFHFPMIDDRLLEAMIQAAEEIWRGEHYDQFIVPAVSGGAGTSINMNINEIIANRALQLLGQRPGDYHLIDPIEHANIFQSTNDVVPTALKVALMLSLGRLEERINQTRIQLEALERNFRNHLRIAYTQMQEAVPTSFGRLFSTYQEALSRDWWRVSKCFERIKVINLGGSAIGTGITVPKFFIFHVADELRQIVKLPVTKSDNLQDATCNLDGHVEVHAIIKAHAVNCEKMASDLRLLSSDLFAHRQLKIPARQVGSSIMPGKVNPVIAEYVVSVSAKVQSNDQLISNLAARGVLELNAYLPLIGHSALESLRLLESANVTLLNHLLQGIEIDEGQSATFYHSASLSTALVPYIGYHAAAKLAKYMKENHCDIFQANKQLRLVSDPALELLISPDQLLQLGFKFSQVKEVMDAQSSPTNHPDDQE